MRANREEEEMSTETVAKHTPGPWKVGTHHIVLTQDCPSVDGARADSIYCIADCGFEKPYHRRGEQEANAHLIAAAPELLEALRLCERLFLPRFIHAPGWASLSDEHEDTVAVRKVFAAIAKADPSALMTAQDV